MDPQPPFQICPWEPHRTQLSLTKYIPLLSNKFKMNSYISILLYLGLAELLRRFVSALILAFTGPLSKIPGPLLWKLTPLPWLYECLTGNMMNVAPGLFEEYGDVVRVGKSIDLKIFQN
jgi:hypothetical protein